MYKIQGQALAEDDAHAVAGEGVRVGLRLVQASRAAGREDDRLGVEDVQFAGGEFVGDDARGYLTRNSEARYDFMLIDAFQGRYVAGNLYTLEALNQFKNNSKYIMANMIGKTNVEHGYSQTLFKNWYQVFGDDAYILTKPALTKNGNDTLQNIMLCNFVCPGSEKLAKMAFFDKAQALHTDDLPRLDRYYYRDIESL